MNEDMNRNRRLGLVLAGFLVAHSAGAAVIVVQQQTFDSDPGGNYYASGFTSSGFDDGFGNTDTDVENSLGALGGGSPSGAGSYQGSFGAQGMPSPQTGVFSIEDTAFVSNYSATYPGYAYYALGFAFYNTLLPTDFLITIGSGSETYVYNALGQLTGSGWNTVMIPFDSGWTGSGSSILNPLAGMDYIEIAWSRNGTASQQFYLDDLTVFGSDTPFEVQSGSAVPEPGTGLLLLGAMVLFALNRSRFFPRETGFQSA